MSFIFINESTENTKTVNPLTITEGLNEQAIAIAEAETQFSNVMLEAVQEEAMIVVSEDDKSEEEKSKKATQRVKEFFEKIRKFFMDVISSVVNFIKNTYKKIKEYVKTSVERLKRNAELAKQAKANGDVHLRKYEEAYNLLDKINLKSLVSVAQESDEKVKKIDEATAKALDQAKQLAKETKVVKVDTAIKTAAKIGSNILKSEKELKVVLDALQAGKKEAEQGIKDADKKDKEAIRAQRVKVTNINRLSGRARRIANAKIGYIRSAVAAVNSGATKAIKNGPKPPKKNKK